MVSASRNGVAETGQDSVVAHELPVDGIATIAGTRNVGNRRGNPVESDFVGGGVVVVTEVNQPPAEPGRAVGYG